MFKQLCYKCGGKVKKSYKKGGQLPRYQQAGEFEEGLRQMEGEEDFSFLYDQMQPQPESQQSSQFYPQNPPLPQLDPNSAGIPIKQSSPDDLSFRDWYRAQVATGKAGDIATWRGKKFLLDPKDFGTASGQNRRSTSSQDYASRNGLNDRIMQTERGFTPGVRPAIGGDRAIINPTPSSRSNTPVQQARPANQQDNTSLLNLPNARTASELGLERPVLNSSGRLEFPNEEKPNWLMRQTNMDNAGKTVLQSDFNQDPITRLVDQGLTGFERTGAAIARTATGQAQDWTDYLTTGLSILPSIPYKTRYYPYGNKMLPQGQAQASASQGQAALPRGTTPVAQIPQSTVRPRWATRQPAPQTEGPAIQVGAPQQKLITSGRPKITQAELKEVQRINKATSDQINASKNEANRFSKNLNNLSPTARKKIEAMNRKLNKMGFQMGGGIPLFDYEEPMIDEAMYPMDYMRMGGFRRF
jgi:hypothetical protein